MLSVAFVWPDADGVRWTHSLVELGLQEVDHDRRIAESSP